MQSISDNKRIAKNSIILYLKLIITSVIGLYTMRVVLAELGAEDFGLYSVVGSIVIMMAIINTSMETTSYRFIAVELGKAENGEVNKIFNTSIIIQIGLGIIFILIGEIIGVWYIRNHLVLADYKISDAIYVFHFSLLTAFFTIVNVSFGGLISAMENFFAKSSMEILGSILMLALVIFLSFYNGNKLQAYAIIVFIIVFVKTSLFFIYCKIKYHQMIAWNFNKNIRDYFEMFNFSGWILVGTVAHMSVRQGAAIVINLFFGTIQNAAFGIASQIYRYVTLFVSNLNQAALPQIMKSYSSGEGERSLDLVYGISKYAFFLMLIPALPIMLSIDPILTLWLNDVPEYTTEFALIMIINALISSSASGFDGAIQATGKIRNTQIWYSVITITTLPAAYLMYELGYPPYFISIISLIATFTNRFVQMIILTRLTNFSISHYFTHTIVRIFIVAIWISPLFYFRTFFGEGIFDVLGFSIISMLIAMLSIYFLGFNKTEKGKVREGINRIYLKISN